MDGPLANSRLPIFNLIHTNVKQALATHPDLQVAISDRPVTGRPSRWAPFAAQIPILGERFVSTMAREDTRRPTMDLGLGVWTRTAWRYYPLETVSAQGNVVLDDLDGRRIAVYFDPGIRAMAAVYVNADAAAWDGPMLRFDGGVVIGDGVLQDDSGDRLAVERPMQLFTRWYGYALTFPETEVFGQ